MALTCFYYSTYIYTHTYIWHCIRPLHMTSEYDICLYINGCIYRYGITYIDRCTHTIFMYVCMYRYIYIYIYGTTVVARAYVSIRQHTSAFVSIRQHTSAYVSIRQHTSAYVSITSAYVSIRQHTSAYVSIRQHTSAYVSIRPMYIYIYIYMGPL